MLTIKINQKSYKNNVVLEKISLDITKNGIYGVIGKNGEGKTTFFRCILALTSFDGEIFFKDTPLTLSEIAWCPTEPTLYDELTPEEFSKFYAELLKMEYNNDRNLFDIPNDRLIKEFSTGMKKKAYLNAVLQKKYSIYIFDEPFNGLDLESNYLLMNYIKMIAKESIVLISSHILEILYKDCDTIFLVKNKNIMNFENYQYSDIEKELFSNNANK
ncbi:ABC transporter ATP-binding protein [Flavobacterium adhaerens]|uniref:ABC transporter ATP-binding protein n=1 Tax=Flavobacterium adhaerens TaxID=3149043 RepID=UPI0032B61FC1